MEALDCPPFGDLLEHSDSLRSPPSNKKANLSLQKSQTMGVHLSRHFSYICNPEVIGENIFKVRRISKTTTVCN
jgi:hypothetical protein